MKMNRTMMMLCAAAFAFSSCAFLRDRIDSSASQTLLETKQIQCTRDYIRVLGLDGGVKIARGESKEIYVDANQGEVVWYCEGAAEANLERTVVPARTNRLIVSRSQGDMLTMQFYMETPPPSRDQVLLKIDEEQCGSNLIRFIGINGDIEVGRDESKEIPIAAAAGEVVWYCEATNGAAVNGTATRKTSVPERANRLIVTRPMGGSSFVVQVFRE